MELAIKATKLDATSDRDPTGHPDANRFDTVFYDEVRQRGLGIMDSTAIEFWKGHPRLPLLSKTWWIALR